MSDGKIGIDPVGQVLFGGGDEGVIVYLPKEDRLPSDAKSADVWRLVKFLTGKIHEIPDLKGDTKFELVVTDVKPGDGFKPKVNQTVTIVVKELTPEQALAYDAASRPSAASGGAVAVADPTKWVIVAHVTWRPTGRTETAVATVNRTSTKKTT